MRPGFRNSHWQSSHEWQGVCSLRTQNTTTTPSHLCVRVLSQLTPRESRRLHLIITVWWHTRWKSTRREARWGDCAKRMITVNGLVFISISVKLYPPWFFYSPHMSPPFCRHLLLKWLLSFCLRSPLACNWDVVTVSSLCAPRPDYSRSSQMQHIYTLYCTYVGESRNCTNRSSDESLSHVSSMGCGCEDRKTPGRAMCLRFHQRVLVGEWICEPVIWNVFGCGHVYGMTHLTAVRTCVPTLSPFPQLDSYADLCFSVWEVNSRVPVLGLKITLGLKFLIPPHPPSHPFLLALS